MSIFAIIIALFILNYGFNMDEFLAAAISEAKKGLAQGGIPIGSVLVINNKIVGQGHNQRIQKTSSILHAEMDCLENAGRLKASNYQQATLYTTLSPCDMCSGAALLYGIPRIVIGENRTFSGTEEYLRSRGVELTIQDNTVMLTLNINDGVLITTMSTLIALLINMLLMFLSFSISKILKKFNILGALIRLTGLIVLTMGIQMVLDGIKLWLTIL